jgi:hypothetical protein
VSQSLPKVPAAPKKDLPLPFKAGDRVMDRRDEVAREDVGGPAGNRRTRPVSMREERDTRKRIGRSREWNASVQRKISGGSR